MDVTAVNSLNLKSDELFFLLQNFQIWVVAYKPTPSQLKRLSYQSYFETDPDFINCQYQKPVQQLKDSRSFSKPSSLINFNKEQCVSFVDTNDSDNKCDVEATSSEDSETDDINSKSSSESNDNSFDDLHKNRDSSPLRIF